MIGDSDNVINLKFDGSLTTVGSASLLRSVPLGTLTQGLQGMQLISDAILDAIGASHDECNGCILRAVPFEHGSFLAPLHPVGQVTVRIAFIQAVASVLNTAIEMGPEYIRAIKGVSPEAVERVRPQLVEGFEWMASAVVDSVGELSVEITVAGEKLSINARNVHQYLPQSVDEQYDAISEPTTFDVTDMRGMFVQINSENKTGKFRPENGHRAYRVNLEQLQIPLFALLDAESVISGTLRKEPGKRDVIHVTSITHVQNNAFTP